ncbi:hypothetical protein [uncultured Jatrophihabitans sp.]|uniref:hypothetical protein n=1 Tax=uncultured Jatrophihabitans sp. TaxID=1610747 RepID=UPI0035C9B687
MTSSDGPQLQSAIDRAAAGERVFLTSCVESDLVLGVGRAARPEQLDLATVRSLALKVQHTRDAGGPLAAVLDLDEHRARQVSYLRSEPIEGNATSVSTFARITVLKPDGDVALFLSGTAADDVADLPVTVELVRCADLVGELVDLAYRDARDAQEMAATSGTETTFIGPDRKTPTVPTRLVHQWQAKDAVMYRWAYTLFARRTESDWVGRKPLVLQRVQPQLYAKHLRGRLRTRTPG